MYYNFASSSKLPGVLLCNSMFGSSFLCMLTASILEGGADGKVRAENPGAFPPNAPMVLIEKIKVLRSGGEAPQTQGTSIAVENPVNVF